MNPLNELVRYEILSDEPEFQHGQGRIWKANDWLLKKMVAIKEIRADLRDDPAAIGSFRGEAAAGARLESPNIVKVTDFGQVGGLLYFVMEWIEGGNLEGACGNISLGKAKSVIRQMCNALLVAHRNGVVHSDIAPANILYDKNSYCYKLADFGYLKIIDSILISRGMKSMMVGGREYFLPPEHFFDPFKINESTDVYALAVTLYTLLTRKRLGSYELGRLKVPGVIQVRHENKDAPDEVRQLLNRFIEGRQDTDTIEEFRRYLDRIPA